MGFWETVFLYDTIRGYRCIFESAGYDYALAEGFEMITLQKQATCRTLLTIYMVSTLQ